MMLQHAHRFFVITGLCVSVLVMPGCKKASTILTTPATDASADDADTTEFEPVTNNTTDPGTGGGTDGGSGGEDTPAGPCMECHGNRLNAAPPQDVLGNSHTSMPSVGAHQTHLRSGGFFRDGECISCHRVPNAKEDPGHIDASPAELTWGPIAQADGTTADYSNGTCTVYCHGVTLGGGTQTQPVWTDVGRGQAVCGSCHSLPPPAPHPSVSPLSCAPCHPFNHLAPKNNQTHINGTVDVTLTCTTCHGTEGAGNFAPPKDTKGNTVTTAKGVGAHQSHLAPSDWHNTIACTDCHVVPGNITDPTHRDGDGIAELTFGALATSNNANAVWDTTTTTCTNYCHGSTIGGGSNKNPTWTSVGTGEADCGTCHSLPPTAPHPNVTPDSCSDCHDHVTVSAGNQYSFTDKSLHINGVVNASGGACGSCHDLPPQTGAHLTHAGATTATYGGLETAQDVTNPAGYAFGCGQCHPRDSSLHMSGGLANVVLYDPTAPASSLKSKHPSSATYVPGQTQYTDNKGRAYTLGTCSDVYCHSGIETTNDGVAAWPIYNPNIPNNYPIVYNPVPTPATRTRVYQSIGWGDATTCSSCHGFPPRGEYPAAQAALGESHAYLRADGFEDMHIWNHGSDPVPCRACHSDTVSTVAAYTRDNMGVTTLSDIPIDGYASHVNGTINVVFDKVNTVDYNGGLTGLTQHSLVNASYDPSTKTCSNVSCHYGQTEVTFGIPYRPMNTLECNRCHRRL